MSGSRSILRAALFALFLGAFTGLFLGPLTQTLFLPLTTAFSMFLQMATFPYICLSLILGMGLIDSKKLVELTRRGVPFIIFLWLSALFFVYFLNQIIPAALPPIYSADNVHKTKDAFDLIIHYLSPKNWLDALAENQILAGFTFSLFMGAVLMHLEKKDLLLPYLERSLEILEKILGWICRISPLGVFLFVSIAFGTIELQDLLNIKYYLLSRIFYCTLFSLVFIPLILSQWLPLNRIYTTIKETCTLPFLSGSSTLLIPFLIRYRNKSENEIGKSDPKLLVAIPSVYCLAHVGATNVIFLSEFLSFYYRISVSLFERLMMYFLFMPVAFGDPTTPYTSSFFITHFNVPVTESKVGAETGLFIHHFLVLMSAVSILAALLFIRHYRKIQWKRAAYTFALFSCLFIGTIYMAKPFIGISDYYVGIYQNRKIADVIENPVKAKLVEAGETGTPRDPTKSRLQQIIQSGILKVGIEEYVVPYSYFNDSSELVGYDIAYAYQLARDLDCSLEFVVADPNQLSEQLDRGDFDLGMAPFLMTENRLRTIEFSQPSFQQEDNVLIVSRSRKGEFLDLNDAQNRPLKILADGAYSKIAKTHFPQAEIVSSHGYSLLKTHQVDACFWTRTSGVTWCILNPDFVAIDYGSALGTSYLAYPIRENSFEFVSFLNNWLKVKEQNGFKKKMINYWILGLPAEKREPRWSIWQSL